MKILTLTPPLSLSNSIALKPPASDYGAGDKSKHADACCNDEQTRQRIGALSSFSLMCARLDAADQVRGLDLSSSFYSTSFWH